MKSLLIIDIESTCWNREDHEYTMADMEIIEIGAVLVRQKKIVDEYQTYIRPTLNPLLSEFCTGLTGITQEQVDNAPIFQVAMEDFRAWLSDRHRWTPAWGSWGNYDNRHIAKQCQRHGIENPLGKKTHVNLKAEWAQAMGCGKRGMAVALNMAGLELEGRHHSGLDDARNIARLAIKAGLV